MKGGERGDVIVHLADGADPRAYDRRALAETIIKMMKIILLHLVGLRKRKKMKRGERGGVIVRLADGADP